MYHSINGHPQKAPLRRASKPCQTDKGNGVDCWDIDGIAAGILAVVNNHDSLADDLARNAVQEVAKLTWKQAAKKLIGVYHGLPTRSQY